MFGLSSWVDGGVFYQDVEDGKGGIYLGWGLDYKF